MRILFDLDTHDYDPQGPVFRRDSARCICIRGGKIMMVHSTKYDYYKFPGGGIEEGETLTEAMIREAREEAGLVVLPDSVSEYGVVPRKSRAREPGVACFAQDNFYFICRAEEELTQTQQDPYEAEEGFTPVWVKPEDAIFTNRGTHLTGSKHIMGAREAGVLELLIKEGYFKERS